MYPETTMSKQTYSQSWDLTMPMFHPACVVQELHHPSIKMPDPMIIDQGPQDPIERS